MPAGFTSCVLLLTHFPPMWVEWGFGGYRNGILLEMFGCFPSPCLIC